MTWIIVLGVRYTKVYRNIYDELPANHAHDWSPKDPKNDREIEREATFQSSTRIQPSESPTSLRKKKGNEDAYQPLVSSPPSFQILNIFVKLVVDLRAREERSLDPGYGTFTPPSPIVVNLPGSTSSLL